MLAAGETRDGLRIREAASSAATVGGQLLGDDVNLVAGFERHVLFARDGMPPPWKREASREWWSR